MAKMISLVENHYKALKHVMADNKAIRESNAELNEELKRAKAELAKMSGEKVAADEQGPDSIDSVKILMKLLRINP